MMESFSISATSLAHLQSALLHSLWQGALAAVVVWAQLRRIPAHRANLRYGMAAAAFASLLLITLFTWQLLESAPASSTRTQTVQTETSEAAPVTPADPFPSQIHAMFHQTAEPAPPSRLPAWPSPKTVITLWLAGVAAMLLRIVRMMHGTRRLRKYSREAHEPMLQAAIAELREAWGMTRRLTVRVTDKLPSPVAMGLFWPVILLPASMATGLPPMQLRAVLAHELAHIHRYDYLVNFLQLVTESLLFFNPAVWWLSRQVRIEREACCDAFAARLIGGTRNYVEALAGVAHRLSNEHTGMVQSLGGEGQCGSLLERLRRLLEPGYRPHVCVRWHGIAGGTLVAAAMLFGLYQGSALGAAGIGWLLSDEERIQVMEQLAEEHDPFPKPLEDDWDRMMTEVSGEIVLPEGGELPAGRKWLQGYVTAKQHTASVSLHLEGTRFHGQIYAGELYIFAEFSGYAPTMAGPITVDSGQPVENVLIPLEPGEISSIRFVDAQGAPVPGLEFTGGYRHLTHSCSLTIRRTSDQNGLIHLDQARVPVPVCVSRAKADGYQYASKENLVLQPGEVYEWVLQEDIPIPGLVVDSATGNPIAGAAIAKVYEQGRGFVSGPDGRVLTVADAHGRFTLNGLSMDRYYYFLVRAPGYGTELLTRITHGDTPIHVEMKPRYVKGMLRGNLSLLDRDSDGATPIIVSGMDLELPLESNFHGAQGRKTPVSIADNGQARFKIDGLRTGELFITAGPNVVRVWVDDPVDDLVIDLPEKKVTTERRVIVKLPAPEYAPPVEGKLGVSILDKDRNTLDRIPDINVANGAAEFAVDVPARLQFHGERLRGSILGPREQDERGSIVNYWDVPEGSGPHVIELPVERAGAIEGRVLRADGSPAAQCGISVRVKSSNGTDVTSRYDHSVRTQASCDPQGKFAFLPLPLGYTLEIQAKEGFCTRKTTTSLTPQQSVRHVELRFPETQDVAVRVVTPGGQPANDVPLSVHYPGVTHSGMRTDTDGRYVFRGVDPSQPFTVTARPGERYQFAAVDLRFDGHENTLRLREGLRVDGYLLESGTDSPLRSWRVSAFPSNNAADYGGAGIEPHLYQVEAITDRDGAFRFTNLCPGTFNVRLRGPRRPIFSPAADEGTFVAGQDTPLIIHVPPRDDGAR